MRKILNHLRKIKTSLFPHSESLLQEHISFETSNPYIAARREWNFMFGNILKAKYNWQKIAFSLGIISTLLVIGIIWISLQSRFIPYIVKVDSLGNANFNGLLTQDAEITPVMVNAMLRRYITEARSVISDSVAQKRQLDFVYRCTRGGARAVLDSFYQKQNPFEIVKNETIEIMINSVLPKSSETWQVQWTEVHRNSSGHMVLQNHFEGLMIVEHRLPANEDDINLNPLGLYVTHLSWASQQ